jgi:hypothetical protein
MRRVRLARSAATSSSAAAKVVQALLRKAAPDWHGPIRKHYQPPDENPGFCFAVKPPGLAAVAYEQVVTAGGRQIVLDWRGRAKNCSVRSSVPVMNLPSGDT